jgi:hypothetical protein
VAENYPGLAETKRPVVIVVGDTDPLCSIPMLYRSLGATGGNVKVVVVAGGHSLRVGDKDDPAFEGPNMANVEAAVRMGLHWMRVVLDRR